MTDSLLMRCSKVAHALDISVRTLKRRVKAGKARVYPCTNVETEGWYFKRAHVESALALMTAEREARLRRAMRAPASLSKASATLTHATTTERG